MLLYFYKLLLYGCCNILNQNFAFLVGFGASSLSGVACLVVNHVMLYILLLLILIKALK